MIAFMQQEAVEKVEEIDTKAEQEFNIEKNSFITQGHLNINEFYDRKEKQIDLQQKIQHSNLVNAHRLAILKAKDDYVQLLKERANKQLRVRVRAFPSTRWASICFRMYTRSLSLDEDEDVSFYAAMHVKKFKKDI